MRRRAILIGSAVIVIGLIAYVASAYVQGDVPFTRNPCKTAAVEVAAVDMVNGAAAQCHTVTSGSNAPACGSGCSGCPIMVAAAGPAQVPQGQTRTAGCTQDCNACPAMKDGTCAGLKGGACKGAASGCAGHSVQAAAPAAGLQAISCQGTKTGACPATSAAKAGCPANAQSKPTSCAASCPFSGK